MGKVPRRTNELPAHIAVLNGGVVGGWRRTVGSKEIVITTDLLVRFSKAERAALGAAGRRYAAFAATPRRSDSGYFRQLSTTPRSRSRPMSPTRF